MQPINKSVYDAVIIGGGHNGLVCAAYLAKAGQDVLVLERRHVLGGACATEEIFPGYQVSTCAYVAYILQDKIVEELALHQHGYQVHQLPLKMFFPFPDGSHLTQWVDKERLFQEITEKYSKRDAEGYLEIQEFWWRAGSLFNRFFLDAHPPTVAELQEQVRGTEEEALLDRLLHGTLTDLVDELFETDEVKGAMISHVMAIHGVDAPGILFAYAATKPNALVDGNNQGIVEGGMGALSESIANAARSFGAKIRTGAEAKRIIIEDGQARGVELNDGQIILSKRIISNADPKRTYLGLVGRDHITPQTYDTIHALKTECATLKFHAIVDELPDFSRYLGPDPDPKQIVSVGICPSPTYYRKSVEDAIAGRMTDSPVIDVQIPTVYDHTVAPEGKHIVSMWVRFYPVHPKEGSWDSLRSQVGEGLIDLITEYAPNFRSSIIDWLLYTPIDIENRVYLTDGNFRHTDHYAQQLLADRLHLDGGSRGGHRTPIQNLYMCGAGTHPGGDVSGAPGHNAAHLILAERE